MPWSDKQNKAKIKIKTGLIKLTNIKRHDALKKGQKKKKKTNNIIITFKN